MGVSKATFQSAGQLSQHLIPGAYSRIDSVKGTSGLVAANNGVIMGQCTGGEPATLLQFNSISEAVATLRSGPLMEAVRLAFNPGGGNSPQRLFAMRVNSATQSTLNLLGTSGNVMIQLKSRDYGLHTTQIQVTVDDGTTSGKRVIVTYKNNSETFDNINRPSLTVVHNTAGITVTNNSNVHMFSSSAGLTVDLEAYPTIGDLAAYINGQSGYTATVAAGQEDASSLELDGVTNQSASGSGLVLYSNMHAVVDALNDGSQYVSATAKNGANNIRTLQDVSTAYLSGGDEGDYGATEWNTALEALEAEDVQHVATPDTSSSVHEAIKTHCETMSAVSGRKERQFWVGGAWGESVDTATTNAVALNSKYGLYAANGGKQYNVRGTLTEYAPSYIACMLMGLKCALALNEPVTHKTLNLIQLEKKYTNSNLEKLIEKGVAPINLNASGVPICVRGVTTYQSADLKFNETSMVTIMNFVSRDLRAYLEDNFIGRPGTRVANGVMKGAVEEKLKQYVDLGLFISDGEKSYWNILIAIRGDIVDVDYDAYITPPINFIFVTNHFHEMVSAAA